MLEPACNKAIKPSKTAFRRAMSLWFGAFRYGGNRRSAFTDVLGGNRMGLFTIFVSPIMIRNLWTRIVRKLKAYSEKYHKMNKKNYYNK